MLIKYVVANIPPAIPYQSGMLIGLAIASIAAELHPNVFLVSSPSKMHHE